MDSKSFVKFSEEFVQIAKRERQTLITFDSFLTTNRNALAKSGVDAVSKQNQVNERLSRVEKLIRNTETRIDFYSYYGTLDEDISKLNSIIAKYPKSMTNDVYLQYASDMTNQIQYNVNHLNVFKEFLRDNDQVLKDAGIDVYKTKMTVEDRLTYYKNTASTIQTNLQQIQYQEQQKKELQDQLVKLLFSLII